jgi:hypothetical protein
MATANRHNHIAMVDAGPALPRQANPIKESAIMVDGWM